MPEAPSPTQLPPLSRPAPRWMRQVCPSCKEMAPTLVWDEKNPPPVEVECLECHLRRIQDQMHAHLYSTVDQPRRIVLHSHAGAPEHDHWGERPRLGPAFPVEDRGEVRV